jgi:deoxyribonucleoside regulator
MKDTFDIDKYQEINLLARCAHLHYRENEPQQKIAEILGLTRSKVSRYMKRILNEGLVEISFNFPELPELAARLCNKYGLRDAIVIPTGEEKYLKADIGQAAARYFERVVGNGARIGISCGMTLYEMVRHIRETSAKNIEIYPLAADTLYESVDISPNTLVGMLVAKLRPNAIGYALPAQIVGNSAEVSKRRNEILANKEIADIFSKAENVDIAFSGVGAIEKGVPGFCMIAEKYGLLCDDIIKKIPAVAEYNYALIDEKGKPLTENPNLDDDEKFQEITNRIISVELETLKELAGTHGKLIVCVAAGSEKVAGIYAVLNGKLANVLITDCETAKALLSDGST